MIKTRKHKSTNTPEAENIKPTPTLERDGGANLSATMNLMDGFGRGGHGAHLLLDLNPANQFVRLLQNKPFKKSTRLFVNGLCSTEEIVKVMSEKAGFLPVAQIESNLLLARGNEMACVTIWGDKSERVTKVWMVALTENQSTLESTSKELERVIKTNFTVIDSGRMTLEYFHVKASGETECETFHLIIPDVFRREAYPFIKEPETFIRRYLTAEEAGLLLYGRPGTGKTRFTRWILQEASKLWGDLRVYFVQSENVLQMDDLYIAFLKDDRARILVLEDADLNLMPRKDGNRLMSKFLTLTDGLIKPLESKKVIFTTNLSINVIDEALMRAGRTFEAVNFDKLNREQARKFLETLGSNAELTGSEFSLAELYAMSRNGRGVANEH